MGGARSRSKFSKFSPLIPLPSYSFVSLSKEPKGLVMCFWDPRIKFWESTQCASGNGRREFMRFPHSRGYQPRVSNRKGSGVSVEKREVAEFQGESSGLETLDFM